MKLFVEVITFSLSLLRPTWQICYYYDSATSTTNNLACAPFISLVVASSTSSK